MTHTGEIAVARMSVGGITLANVIEGWTIDRVLATAPDSASAVAGRKLASLGPWSDLGSDGPVLWGHCRGSAREPYRVVVDTAAPRYQCSCPSRKFPCKHALGLLFLYAEARLPRSPDVRPGAAAAGPAPEAEATSVTPRSAERDARVENGLVELRQWLADRMSDGLGRLAASPGLWEEMAARMVDAQAPGVARRLRRLARLPAGADAWAAQVLSELGMLDLLARAFADRARLPEDLVASVRAHLGFTVPRAEVLATPGVADRWAVAGLHDTADDERVATRRVWLWGRRSGRFAVLLLFSVNGAPFEMTVAPGMELDADLHFYPGRPPLRALIGARRGQRDVAYADDCGSGPLVADAREAWVEAVAADPWLTLWPVALRGRITADTTAAVPFRISDEVGDALPVHGPEGLLWQALASSGGDPATWFGELRPDGFAPLVVTDPTTTGGELMVL